MTWKNFAGLMIGVSICAAPFVYFSEDTTQGYSSSIDSKVYGVMTDDTSQNSKLYAIQTLGLSATRESILTSTYKGTAGRLQFWNNNNIKMYLNINSYPQGEGYGFQTPDTFIPVMLSIAKKYKPYFIFVENEPLNNSYHEGDLFGDYTKLIKVVIDSAHANGFKVADGGITSRKIVQLTYRWLASTHSLNAAYFLEKCVPTDDTAWLVNYMTDEKKERELSLNETLLRWYSNTGIDAINLHLYMPFKNRTKGTTSDKGNGIVGLNYVIDYIRSVHPNKQIISNELGFVENDTELSNEAYKALVAANIKVCFYGGKGAKKFMRDGLPTKLGQGIINYKNQ